MPVSIQSAPTPLAMMSHRHDGPPSIHGFHPDGKEETEHTPAPMRLSHLVSHLSTPAEHATPGPHATVAPQFELRSAQSVRAVPRGRAPRGDNGDESEWETQDQLEETLSGESVTPSVSQSVSQSVRHPVSQSVRRSDSQSVSQLVRQSVGWSAYAGPARGDALR